MKKFKIALMLLLLIPGMLSAAEPYYDSGSQMFSIKAGVTTPFFYYNPANDKNNEEAEKPPVLSMWPGMGKNQTQRTIGGVASIAYQVFLNPYLALGGELGFQFDFSKSDSVETNVPIFMKLTYMPVQTGKIDVPISIGAGFLYAGYEEYSKITFGCEFEIGVRFFITESWGVGVNVGMYLFPEIYTSNTDWFSMLSYIPATVSVTYRH